MTKKPTYEELGQRVNELEKESVEWKQTEKKLQESEKRYSTLSEASFEGILIHEKGVILDANSRFAQMYGYELNELIGKDALELIAPEHRDTARNNIVSGYEGPYEVLGLRKDSSIFQTEIRVRHMMSNGRNIRIAVARDITEHKQAEEALRNSEEKYKLLAEKMVDIVWTIDRDFQTTYVSPSIENVLGFTPEERKRQALKEVITPESLQNVQMKFLEELQRDEDGVSDPNRPVTIEVEYYRKDGSTVWMENIMSAIRGRDGAIVGIHGVSRDITLRKQAEEALRESEQKYRTVLEANPDPVIVYDIEGKVLYLNPAFTRVFGWSSKERFGKKMDVFVPEETWSETKMMIDKVLAGEAFSGIETHRYTKEGKLIPVSISGATYRDLEDNYLGTVVNLRDISEQKSLEEKLERLSYLDGLTGVANRRHFDINLDLEWRRMARLDKSLSLIMCDIDFFKAYNDTYGHQAGDKCLKAVGNVLKGSAKRAGDLVARYGGEEFTVLLPMTDAEKAFIIAEKIQRDINSLKVQHKKSEVSGVVTLSFGIATLFPHPSKSPNDLVELADKALYRAKNEGRNKVIIS